MSDLISRQAAIKTVHRWLSEVFGVESTDDSFGVFGQLRELPSVRLDLKRGQWERKRDGVFCSACGRGWEFLTGVPAESEQYNFCPFCGADMRGGEDAIHE